MTVSHDAEPQAFDGCSIDVRSAFIGGQGDWGVYRTGGTFERMQHEACTRTLRSGLLESAGYRRQQEQLEAVNRMLLEFLDAR